MKTAIFSCEASLNIGTGHVIRCITLANFLENKGWKCFFATSNESYNFIKNLEKFTQIQPQEFYKNPQNCDLLIVDNYNLDEKYESHFREFAQKILVIDDLANRKHNCDILLDQNIGSKVEDYENLVGKNCEILAGTKYCLLREEFLELRQKALEKRSTTKNIANILVNFGGSDLKNHSLNALQEIEKSKFSGEINVVLGFDAVNLKTIEEFAQKSKNKITIHKQANMAKLIYDADIAFAAGGTSTWERCSLALPTYMVKIADNQGKIFTKLGFNGNFEEFYYKVSANYQKFFNEIKDLVDAQGTQRIYSSIIN